MTEPSLAQSGIYCIRNEANGKKYVGSTINLHKRFLDHRRLLNRREHHSVALQRAWNKYGEESFSFEVIESVPNPTELLTREQHWIDEHQSFGLAGYNMCPIAGSTLGRKMSDEQKEALRESHIGRKASAETRAKISEAGKGRKRSEESILKSAQFHLGRKRSEETKQRIREAVLKIDPTSRLGVGKGRKMSEANKQAIILANTGRKMSEESNLKKSKALKGRIFSDEHRARLSAAHKGKKLTAESIAKRELTKKLMRIDAAQ